MDSLLTLFYVIVNLCDGLRKQNKTMLLGSGGLCLDQCQLAYKLISHRLIFICVFTYHAENVPDDDRTPAPLQHFTYWKVWKSLQTLPEGLCNFLSWRYSESEWAKLRITWSILALCRAGFGMGEFQRFFPAFIILWYYDLKVHIKVILTLFHILMSLYVSCLNSESHVLQGMKAVSCTAVHSLSKTEARRPVYRNLDSSSMTFC